MLTIHQSTRRKKSIHPSTRTKNHSIQPRAQKSVYPCKTKSFDPQKEEKIMHNWSFCRKLSSAFLCCLYNRLSLPSLRKDTCLLLFFLSTILIWNQPLFWSKMRILEVDQFAIKGETDESQLPPFQQTANGYHLHYTVGLIDSIL